MKTITSKILLGILLICIVVSLFTAVSHMNNEKYKTETAVYTQEDDSVSFKAVYVRNEEVLSYSGKGVVSYSVPDGGKLGAGSLIAEVYPDESQINVKQRMEKIQSDIAVLKKIQNPGTMEQAQPQNLSALISDKYINIINSREKGDVEDISSDIDELIVLLSTYQMVTEKASDLKKKMNDLNTEYTQLSSREMVPMDTIRSDKSAYFVSFADGYEDKFSMENLSSITADMIDEVSDSNKTNEKNIIGKLITDYEWYVVGVVDSDTRKFSVEDDVKLKFQSTSEIIAGTVHDIRHTQDENKSIVVVKCGELTQDLVRHRTERVEMIKGQHKGIKVPEKAIRFKDMKVSHIDEKTGERVTSVENVEGVYIKLGEQITFKMLKIVYRGDGFVLSARNAGSDYVSIYDDVIVEGVDADGS